VPKESNTPPSWPPPDDLQPRRSMRILPWWRRVSAWVQDFHKFVTVLLSVATATVAAHVWIQGLVRRGEVKDEVKAAVSEALREVHNDLTEVKDRTSADLPRWRGKVDERLSKVEDKTTDAIKLADKANDRFDRYFERRQASK
jgi:hypothetical protein